MPFGLTPEVFTDYALRQFETRLNRIASAMGVEGVDRRYRQEATREQ